MSSQDKLIAPKFVPTPNLVSKRIYSNFVSITTTGLDFTLSFGDVIPPTKEDVEKAKKGQEVPIPLQCQVVLPISLIPSLVNALNEQYGKYKKEKSQNEGSVRLESNKPKGEN